jgi:phosphohistidine phosphatase
MKRVYLLRHAKSSWKEPGLPDRDRPLSGRGRRAAGAIGRYLRDQRIAPELVLCSPARRARETLERIEPAFGARGVRVEPRLYGATPDMLLELLRGVPETVASVMLIGHNPGLERLAVRLARPSPQLRALEAKYPTAALATLAFGVSSWRALDVGTGELVGFVRPRDLDDPPRDRDRGRM